MADALQLLLHVVGGQDLFDHAIHVKELGVVAGVALLRLGDDLALDKVLVIVEVSVVGADAEIAAHILRPEPLLPGHQGLIKLLSVPGPDDAGAGIAKEALNTLGQVADRAGVGLLDKEVAGIGMLEGKADQVDRLIQVHQETGHLRVSDCDRMSRMDLFDKERDHRSPGAHDIAVAGTADDRIPALRRHTGVGKNDMFHHGLGGSHGIDRIGRLVGGKADDPLNTGINGSMEDVVRPLDIGFDRLHGEKLAGGNLLEGRRVPDIIDAGHGIRDRPRIPDIADVELDLGGRLRVRCLQDMAHVILLLLIAGEDTDLPDVRVDEMLENRGTEGTGSASDQ